MPWKALKLNLGGKIHEEHVRTNMVKCLTILENLKHMIRGRWWIQYTMTDIWRLFISGPTSWWKHCQKRRDNIWQLTVIKIFHFMLILNLHVRQHRMLSLVLCMGVSQINLAMEAFHTQKLLMEQTDATVVWDVT